MKVIFLQFLLQFFQNFNLFYLNWIEEKTIQWSEIAIFLKWNIFIEKKIRKIAGAFFSRLFFFFPSKKSPSPPSLSFSHCLDFCKRKTCLRLTLLFPSLLALDLLRKFISKKKKKKEKRKKKKEKRTNLCHWPNRFPGNLSN